MRELTLYGEFNLRIDERRRLALPKEVRVQMAAVNSEALVARGGHNSTVWLFPESFYDEQLAQRSDEGQLGFDLRSLDLAVVARLLADRRGRVTVPESLLQYFCLEDEVTLIGVKDHFELWSRSVWQERRAGLVTLLTPLAPS